MIKSSNKNVTKKDAESFSAFLVLYDSFQSKPNLSFQEFKKYDDTNTKFLELLLKYYPDASELKEHYIRRVITKNPRFSNKDFLEYRYKEMAGTLKRIPDSASLEIVNGSKKYKRILNKYFSHTFEKTITKLDDIADAKNILKDSSKVSYLRTAGVIASNYISKELTNKFKNEGMTVPQNDDIKNLAMNLKKTKNKSLSKFINDNFERFKSSSEVRNRCAHVNRGEPTKQEILQLIDFAKIINKNLN